MKLEDQVCTLEQARTLCKLGIVQGTSFLFYDTLSKKHTLKINEGKEPYYYGEFPEQSCFSAFTVAELGVMLPILGIRRYKSNNGRGNDFYWLEFQSEDWSDINEASLLAKFMIYLLENNLTTPEELNNRLNP